MKKSKDFADKLRRRKLRWMFSSAVFFILLGTFLLLTGAAYLLMALDVLNLENIRMTEWYIVLIFLFSSIVIGMIITFIVSRFVMGAVNTVADGMSALSKGDFSVRIDLGKGVEGEQLAGAFNKLAEELENTQMLRSDFINEYAHEFKTPIVSIKGFAELLNEPGLTEEQRKEYVAIIIEETKRLERLSYNSLNLSRIEKQGILTDCTRFNVSEQIRSSILILEKKWIEKKIDLEISIDEHYVVANEEMLKQVWLNLVDNAIKFSAVGGVVAISVKSEPDYIVASFKNGGTKIAEEDKQKIFDKFFRADTEKGEGHGVGLTIVKKIVDLHKGKIVVDSDDNVTEFRVYLPI